MWQGAERPLQVESGFFHIDGLRLEFQRLTPAQQNRPTLVFLHEGLGCVAMWRDFPRQVAAATNCPVLVYSRAGYGGSSPCPLPRPVSFMHEEGLQVLPKILSAADIDQAVLVGHSDGASIALIGAGELNDPRFKGLVLLAPHVFVEELTLSSIRQARVSYQDSHLRERLARYHGERVDETFNGWCDVWLAEDFARWNIEDCLPMIRVPVLLIQGEDDNYGTLRQLQVIAETLPQEAEQVVLPGSGHSPFRDRPAETLQAMVCFLQNRFPVAGI